MNRRRFRLLGAALTGLAAAVTLLVSTELFPYHSVNHDEAVYLQQAAMLLDGTLSLAPPVLDSFRPWFFFEEAGRLYPKYAPVPAAMFAVGEALGEPRISLVLIAAGNVALAIAVASEAFDRRTGLLAGAFLLASPLFVVDSAVFLPYAPTAFWNLLFAFGYIRAARRAPVLQSGAREESPSGDSSRASDSSNRRTSAAYAALAGLAIGIAFFSRPYTAVLFALPFIAHALYSLVTAVRRERRASRGALAEFASPTVVRLSITAVGGLAGVATALVYNAVVTGSPWLFPYEAFAPADGLGFGHREILGHSEAYTPALGLRANAEVVRELFTEWVVGGSVGTLLAALGVAEFLRRASVRPSSWSPEFTDAQAKALLAGLFVSVVAGNVYFWGNLNLLGDLADPDDGLIVALGPYYHFDLLVPTAAFAARGTLLVGDRVRAWTERTDHIGERGRSSARGTAAALALATALVLAGATGAVLAPPVADNAETTGAYEDAYAPFEDREFSNAVVFVPTPYGDWLNHPFQHLRNDPGYDGDAVFAVEDGSDDLAVVSAFPNRTYYRYVYRGAWVPFTGESVTPAIQRVDAVEGERVTASATLGLLDSADRVSVRLASDGGVAYYAVNDTSKNLTVEIRVENGSARLAGPGLRSSGDDATVPVADEDEVRVEVFVNDRAGGGFSYRLELPVRIGDDGTVRALSPIREACLSPATCGGEAAYVERAMPDGIRMETELRADSIENATA
ncbi:DUF7846 domain-containing protein [Halorussus litoreus]|uniref:DUF7846 domain-containing protein n=1 Tax=Halorussus litoreus TaxID=1710536 RepID=UPI000E2749F6|nr:hypothetical protein [Halorussus litoreus]